jgi:hypothetical protein
MDIQHYNFANPKEFEQMCDDAAAGCFYPAKTQREHAMAMVIQNLVLPRGKDDFDKEKMKTYIQRKLQVIMATRTVLDETP